MSVKLSVYNERYLLCEQIYTHDQMQLRPVVAFKSLARYKSISLEPLADTVAFYKRHVLLCTGKSSWPANPFSTDKVASSLFQASMKTFTRITHTSIENTAESGRYDMLLFPDCLKLHNVGLGEVAGLAAFLGEERAIEDTKIEFERMDANRKWIMVCTHGEHDCRCGSIGGSVYATLKSLDSNKYCVFRSAHIGGHKYALLYRLR